MLLSERRYVADPRGGVPQYEKYGARAKPLAPALRKSKPVVLGWGDPL